jgi:hypothetical protein
VGAFDWLKRKKAGPQPSAPSTPVWSAYREGSELVADDSRGSVVRVPLASARSVRVVPMAGGNHHRGAGAGYQVAVACAQGDVPVGKPMADWRLARDLADKVCAAAELPLDELTQKMFSRVGTFSPKVDV